MVDQPESPTGDRQTPGDRQGTLGERTESGARRILPLVWIVVGLALLAGVLWFTFGGDEDDDETGDGRPATSTTVGESTTTTTEAPREPILYVAPDGDDRRDGRQADAPVATLERAFAEAEPGDEIRMAPGTYDPVHLEGVGGEPDAPIVVVAPNGGVTIEEPTFTNRDALLIQDVHHVIFEGLTIKGGIHGTYVQASSHLVFRGIHWIEVGQEGLQMNEATTDILVEDCLVNRTGLREGDLDGIPYANFGEGFYIGSSSGVDPVERVTIRNCEIANTTAEAIDIKPGVRHILVEGNRIHDINTANSGAIVAGLVHQVVIPHFEADIVIRNNMIWNVTSTSQWADGNAIVVNTPALIYNNVMWNLEHRGILVDANFENPDARTVHIFNNTIYNAGLVPIEIREGGNGGIGVLINNIGPDNLGNLVARDDLFVDPANGDFRLAPGSAAIDAGESLSEYFETDIDGRPRPQGVAWDIGAYEADAPPPPPTTTAGATTSDPSVTPSGPTTGPATTVPDTVPTTVSTTAPTTA